MHKTTILPQFVDSESTSRAQRPGVYFEYTNLSLMIPEPNALDRLRPRRVPYPIDKHPIFQCSLDNNTIHTQIDPLLFKCSVNPRTQVSENSFFHRTYIEWNKLPISIIIQDNLEIFQKMLCGHIWELLREQVGISEWPD